MRGRPSCLTTDWRNCVLVLPIVLDTNSPIRVFAAKAERIRQLEDRIRELGG